jgi:hypothetical protein
LLYIARDEMTNLNRSDDNDLLVALRHPLRRAILQEMGDKKAISPRDLSIILHKSLSSVSYHVGVLANRAAISLVGTKPAGGSMQHFYRVRIEAPWARQLLGWDEKDKGSAGESSTEPRA